MLKTKAVFSGFSVNDLEAAKHFYTEVLGLAISDDTMGLTLELPHGGQVFIYEKGDHTPASFTILNIVVDNIDEAVDYLTSKNITFERYDSMPMPQDDKGILRGLGANQGPDIAWFTDPAKNVIAVLQDK